MFLYSDKPGVSPEGKVNDKDLKKIARDTAIFFAAPIFMYTAQLTGTLNQNQILLVNDFIPSATTIGAIQGWAIGIVINFFLKLKDGSR